MFVNLNEKKFDYDKSIEETLSFGVEYLNRALKGIRKNDLILLGGESGTGKTELAVTIAENNPDKHIIFYALEAEKDEVYNRLLFKICKKLYYQHTGQNDVFYDLWLIGYDRHKTLDFERRAIEILKSKYGNLRIFERTKEGFGVAELQMSLYNSEPVDLIIIDHLHYFDTHREDENKAYKDIVKALRDMVLINNIPMILIAHLRKKGQFQKRIIPGMDDFHGSSDIFKIATKVITLAPTSELESCKSYLFPTLFRVCKNRINGAATRYIGVHDFDIRTNSYVKDYFNICRLSKNGESLESIDSINSPEFLKYNLVGEKV